MAAVASCLINGSQNSVSGDEPMPSVPFAHGAMTPIVAAIADVEAVLGEPPTIVGGIAVLCRAGTAYRATGDLDTAASSPRGSIGLLEMLRATERAEAVAPAGVDLWTRFGTARVDVIDVPPLAQDEVFTDPADRLYAMSHLWAIESATPMRLIVMDGIDEVETVVARIAEPGPLVAMKLQSAPDRGSAKEGTDLFDIVRLSRDPATAGKVMSDLRQCDRRIAHDCGVLVQRVLGAGRGRALSLIRAAGAEDATAETLDDVVALVMSAVER